MKTWLCVRSRRPLDRYRNEERLAFQPCPGIASVVIQVNIPDTDVAENILHVSKGSSAAWTATELTNLVNAIDTWITTGDGAGNKFTSFLQQDCTVVGIQARDLTTQNGPEVSKSVSHAGADTSGRTAAGLSFAMTLRTGLAGRSNRGRVFLMGLPQALFDVTDKNLVTSTKLANMVLAWTSLIAAVTGVNAAWNWCVLSRYNNNARRTNGQGVAITSVGYSNPYVDYQRRRSPFHARHH